VVSELATAREALEAGAIGSFGQRLKAREPLVGTVVTVPCVAMAELTAHPVDFVWIDLEHGTLGVAGVQPLAIACRAAGAAALVRLPDAGGARAGAILDAGADGVVAPHVESAERAAELAGRLRHPPLGSRGVASRRGNGYGRQGSAGGAAPVLVAQIESPGGVRQAAAIAAVDGVDALVVGCADLSHSLGDGGRLRTPAVLEAVGEVQHAAAAAGIPSGIAGPDDPALLAGLAAGRSSLLVLSADVRMYARAVDSGVAAARREQLPPEQVNAHVGA
jgi:2-keto-3-deoxy-L-rhamnonate aldolase RhmA